jgi:tetratricopeptide (TPR) repeat protein
VIEPLILKFYGLLPQPDPRDFDDHWTAGVQDALRAFRDSVRNNYNEGTLCRLLDHPTHAVRQSAVLALGLIGTMQSNTALAKALQDEDCLVRRFAHDALWEVWFRGVDPEHSWALQQALQLNDFAEALAAMDDLIATAPDYAEAYNQRAMLYFRRAEYARSAHDCKTALRLNPCHFGAAAGLGQCLLRLKKPRAALRAFEQALTINPQLGDLEDAVRALQDALGEAS